MNLTYEKLNDIWRERITKEAIMKQLFNWLTNKPKTEEELLAGANALARKVRER